MRLVGGEQTHSQETSTSPVRNKGAARAGSCGDNAAIKHAIGVQHSLHEPLHGLICSAQKGMDVKTITHCTRRGRGSMCLRT